MALVQILGQPLNESIIVKVDPIVTYRLPGDAPDAPLRNDLAHLPVLFQRMAALGLTRLHMSFTQICNQRVAARLRKMRDAKEIDFVIIEPAQQAQILRDFVLPYSEPCNITLQTCTAMDIVRGYPALKVKRGSCLSLGDLQAIDPLNWGKVLSTPARHTPNEYCTCVVFDDVGDKWAEECTHGCRYCLARPKIYAFNQPPGTETAPILIGDDGPEELPNAPLAIEDARHALPIADDSLQEPLPKKSRLIHLTT